MTGMIEAHYMGRLLAKTGWERAVEELIRMKALTADWEARRNR